jgi:hypothetical protein
MLPRSAAAADLSRQHGVPILAVIPNLQALRHLLGPAHAHQTLEDVFQEAMHQHEEINLPRPSADVLAIGRLHLRPMFAHSLSTAAQRHLAVTIAYALLKFGLQGCTMNDATSITQG